ncbi:LysR family transcriptional regulator [Prauserella flavalba]|uniref:LysR family transcriptional regulator n=1 Tax=Prauserella flavalba TaxID=1477506 RepID=A0A318M615_9PSEU|nr:LysR family transcriptional regulator [Prauserella flavalba]PXY38226.1 LysR family transcriptional regulator [Prauserella flavalba]
MDLLAHLEAYVAVTEEGSFSRAADVLYVAQPVLSRRIKTLEQHLGGELFDRSRRQITSTDLGVQLLPHAKDVLSRVEHLRQVARAALASAAQPVGVPPDCDPATLARVISSGARRGVTISVRELPAEERADALAAGSLTFALLRVPPEAASHRVPLGLATSAPLPTRTVHLESLRPRRGAPARQAPPILLTAEDGPGFAAERFDKAAARAGLAEERVRRAASTAAAVAETLAGHAMLLCAEPLARRHELAWTPLADESLHRGYELARTANRDVPAWLEPLLVAAVGARAEPAELPADRDVERPDVRARLAARG